MANNYRLFSFYWSYKTYTKLSEYMQPKTTIATTIDNNNNNNNTRTHTLRTQPPHRPIHRRDSYPADLLAFAGVLTHK